LIASEIFSYDDLLAVLRARMHELNITFDCLDHISGLQSNYSAKLLGARPVKTLGPVSLGAVLGSLALRITVSVDHEAEARLRHRWVPREIALPVRSEMPVIAPQLAAGESSVAAGGYMPS
jgi:hypothetical protein